MLCRLVDVNSVYTMTGLLVKSGVTTAIPRALARAWAFRHPRSALASGCKRGDPTRSHRAGRHEIAWRVGTCRVSHYLRALHPSYRYPDVCSGTLPDLLGLSTTL